jgi:hypothetical protein
MPTVNREETIARLRAIAGYKPGDQMPTWMHNQTNNWGVVLSELCRDAVDLIEGKTDAYRNR